MSRVLRRVPVDNVDGIDFVFISGLNDDNRRVIAILMRETGATNFYPVIELDVGFPNYYKDTESGVIREPIVPPPPQGNK